MPLGIGNHSFYEPYSYAIANRADESAYYGLLLDRDGNWLDGSVIGIDGTLLHYDADEPSRLHFWILAFERHSFAGHFVIDLNLMQLGLVQSTAGLARLQSAARGAPVNLTEFE